MNTALAPIAPVVPLAALNVTLTSDQQAALDAFNLFLIDPLETVFVLQGYSGCGKTTLVRTIIDRLPGFMKTARLIDPNRSNYTIELTATTNKAAENLAHITGMPAKTIHSYLSLRVQNNFKEDTTTLIPRSNDIKEGVLLFVDEASYVDKQLLGYIFKFTNPKNCKIVFVGDSAQLTPVKATTTPVFEAGFNGAKLTEVVRQVAGNPIVDLSTKFRHTVLSGNFFHFKPDGYHIQALDRSDFMQAIESEFGRPDWRYRDSKVLAWTNKTVIAYNHHIRNHVKGDPLFQVGDYAVCNSFITVNRQSLKTDQLVEITGIETGITKHGIGGKNFQLDNTLTVFMPDSLADRNARIKNARGKDDYTVIADIETSWIDLRAAFACTVNKAQGSTFDEVFIDLDDIAKCNNGEQIARMLYVAVSRARHHVYLVGDLA